MISVALCTFNGEKYIEKQVNSIMNQTHPIDEIIISDDGSKDETYHILLELKQRFQENVKFIIMQNVKPLGVTKNFEKAIASCSGDIIFTADQDDIWKNDKVALFMEEFHSNTDALLVFSNGRLVDQNDDSLHRDLWSSISFNQKETYMLSDFMKSNFVTGAAMAFRKELIDLAFPIPNFWLHDAWLALVAINYGRIMSIAKCTFDYRIHDKNVVGVNGTSLTKKIKKWFDNIHHLEFLRLERLNRWETFYVRFETLLDENNKKIINECIAFWYQINKLNKESKIKSVIRILKLLISGKYYKFYTGVRGAFRDILSLFS